MDEASERLITQLLLADFEDALEAFSADGLEDDSERRTQQLAWAGHAEYLRRGISFNDDNRMARSLNHACRTDGALIIQARLQEQTAAADRDFARRLAEGGGIRPILALPSPSQTEGEASAASGSEADDKLSPFALVLWGDQHRKEAEEDDSASRVQCEGCFSDVLERYTIAPRASTCTALPA
ncbi:hypothetical protein H2203_002513 [Taxawa tesnikishii (nom. ined.)]|nr:hypothetical protein H2203_002513 [Dothideales sp. JES 119]